MQEPVQFRWDAGRLNWYSGLMVLIGALGILLVLQPEPDVKALGIAWAATFAYAIYALQRRKRIATPVVTISGEGVLDRRASEKPFTWDQITRVEGFDVEHVPFVGLIFRDPKAALADCKPLVRMFAPLHRLLRYPDVSISMSLLDGEDADLLMAIRAFRPEMVVHDG